MDSLSQILLGAATAAVVAPDGHRRRALLLGAALGTLPDLDVLIDYGDAVANMTQHRGFSHSLFLLSAVSLALWGLLCASWSTARAARWRWLAVIALPLLTHPLLDALTVYGTQLFWPLTTPPVMGGSIFIIDPLYTLPLLIAVLTATFAVRDAAARRVLALGLLLSTAYLGWGLSAQAWVDRIAARSLDGTGLEQAPRLVIASPFNSVLWRILVLTPEGYLEGQYSLWADRGEVAFEAHAFERGLLDQAAALPAVQRLLWFSHGYQRADLIDGELVLSDLRMGQHPTFFFAHAVGRRDNGAWVAADNRRLAVTRVQEGQLAALWRRIWSGASPG
jgi:inner membrane protein